MKEKTVICDFPSKDKDFDEIRLAYVSDKFKGNEKTYTFIIIAVSHRDSALVSCINAMNMNMLIDGIEAVGITNIEDLERIYEAFKTNDKTFTKSLSFPLDLDALNRLIDKWREYERIYEQSV